MPRFFGFCGSQCLVRHCTIQYRPRASDAILISESDSCHGGSENNPSSPWHSCKNSNHLCAPHLTESAESLSTVASTSGILVTRSLPFCSRIPRTRTTTLDQALADVHHARPIFSRRLRELLLQRRSFREVWTNFSIPPDPRRSFSSFMQSEDWEVGRKKACAS